MTPAKDRQSKPLSFERSNRRVRVVAGAFSMVEALPATPDPFSAVDMAKFEPRLKELIESYRDGLRVAVRLPRLLGIRKTRIFRRFADSTKPHSSSEKSRLVARPFVRMFIELHIRAKLGIIINVLKIEAISVEDESNEQTKKLKSYIGRLEKLRKSMLGWDRLYGLLTKVPLLSAGLSLIGALLIKLLGIDFSNTQALITSVSKMGGWPFVVSALKLAATLLILLYMVLGPALIALGFRYKRAIFEGGETTADPLEQNPYVTEVEKWDLPPLNVYEKENRVFEVLGVAKPQEFPLDLIAASVVPFYSLAVAVVVSIDLVQKVLRRETPSMWQWLGIVAFWFLVISLTVSGVGTYRQRRQTRQM